MFEFCNLDLLQEGDIILYPYYESNRGWFMERGVVQDCGTYAEGIYVHGDGWKQYISKYDIHTVLRGEEIIYTSKESSYTAVISG